MSLRHGPNRLNNYLETHESILGWLLYRGAVTEDRLTVSEGARGTLIIRGELALRSPAVTLKVVKSLDFLDDKPVPLVQTGSYSYNLSVAKLGNVFRFDSPHDDGAAVSHHRYHHKHLYDPFGSGGESVITSCDSGWPFASGDWPVLSEVIEEAEAWYWDHQAQLAGLGLT